MDDHDDPARAAEARRSRRGPADGLSTAERLERLRDGLRRGVRRSSEPRQLPPADPVHDHTPDYADQLDEDVYGDGVGPRADAAPAQDASLVRSMLREIRPAEQAPRRGSSAPIESDPGEDGDSIDDTLIDPVTGGAILRAPVGRPSPPRPTSVDEWERELGQPTEDDEIDPTEWREDRSGAAVHYLTDDDRLDSRGDGNRSARDDLYEDDGLDGESDDVAWRGAGVGEDRWDDEEFDGHFEARRGAARGAYDDDFDDNDYEPDLRGRQARHDSRQDSHKGSHKGSHKDSRRDLRREVRRDPRSESLRDDDWDEEDEWSRDDEPARPGVGRRGGGEARYDEPRRPAGPVTARRLAPFSGLERLITGRYLRARRKEGFISVIALLSLIGIMLGVATLIIVMSVMNGFRAELVSKIVGVNGHLTVMTLDGRMEDYEELAQKVASVPGVTRAAPLIEGQAFASTARAGAGVLVRGVSQSNLLTLENVAVSPEMAIGSLATFGAEDGVAIGERLARKLGVTVGDSVTLLSPRGAVTAFGVAPRRKTYPVLYVFKVGMAQYDEGVVFMPLEEAQKFFNKAGVADAIETMVATPERLDGYREDIEAIAADRPLYIGDWKESNGSLIGALRTERTVMFLILSLLIVIASLIIISGLIMLVKEKRSNIAILRTMGMTRGAILRVFFMCGATIGVLGTLAGVVIGVLFCLNIEVIQGWVEYFANGEVFPEDVYVLSRLPAQLHWEDVGLTVGITLGLSFLATLYPAWRAARLDPVEALRYE